ncbi:probable gluconokinase isoform X2 [Hydractinia symbiolongicarpus]|uniref:probable gluconokinase isoform X2 n=1 Tax=Hydractinia symbiolongicarpus TaxID=13093 RepID=UPI002550E3E4|nr:probable gluconokinase isoform X2 [Hydractinia symbiolongicarpus]XP_057305312.1 probable gluconokinase isoform X2 [Hydractinia symbiolongicarpus]
MSFVLVMMGVSGSGKTTIGTAVSTRLNCDFIDGDSYHSSKSIQKMQNGEPLHDMDRKVWLETLRSLIARYVETKQNLVLACSALKEIYRQKLSCSSSVWFVYLKGYKELISSRLKARQNHFMSPALLDSQFNALEEPQENEERILLVNITNNVTEVVDFITNLLMAKKII